MRITSVSAQQKDPNRVNVMVDGKFRFSLDVFQLSDLSIKVGHEYTEQELTELETESQFGKLYSRALEYCLMRPHSAREVKDYLFKKTFSRRYKSRRTGELKERPGVSRALTERVFERLLTKGYINDEKFTRYWIENRNQTKGISRRKLQAELMAKGIERQIIERTLMESERHDGDELRKMVIKKRMRYPDNQKLMRYLAGQGFGYDDIKSAIDDLDEAGGA